MIPFFSPERLEQLAKVAESWRDTRFMPNAAIKKAGVSCQKLVAAIYIECGALPADFVCPDGPMNWATAQKESLIEKFMDEQKQYFQPLKFPEDGVPRPGDMIGFQIGGCVHHSGILINRAGRLVHCMRPDGVRFNNILDATFWSRMRRVWRPLEVNHV